MSHKVDIDIKVYPTDLVALTLACDELGLVLNRNATKYHMYQGSFDCDMAIELKKSKYNNDYSMGLKKTAAGYYELSYDPMGGLSRAVGPKAGKLLQSFATAKLEIKAKQRGWRINKTKEGNKVKLQLRKG